MYMYSRLDMTGWNQQFDSTINARKIWSDTDLKWCIANKIVRGRQMTESWHLDDLLKFLTGSKRGMDILKNSIQFDGNFMIPWLLRGRINQDWHGRFCKDNDWIISIWVEQKYPHHSMRIYLPLRTKSQN